MRCHLDKAPLEFKTPCMFMLCGMPFGHAFFRLQCWQCRELHIACAPLRNAVCLPLACGFRFPLPRRVRTAGSFANAERYAFCGKPRIRFLCGVSADCAALLDAYAAGLSALQSVDGLSYSLALTEHRALLSEGRITIARLFGSDDSGYSGTLESAASGSGSMYGSPEKGYTFQFSYTDGNTLAGSLSGAVLRFTISSPKGVERFCSMEKAGDTWLSTACTSSYQSELTVCLSPAEGGTPIRFGMRTGNYLPVTESTAAPEGE